MVFPLGTAFAQNATFSAAGRSRLIAIYEAETSVDAHLLRGLLEQRGVPAHVVGEYLQGGVGELPAFGLVRVLVAEEHAGEAREVVEAFEAGKSGSE